MKNLKQTMAVTAAFACVALSAAANSYTVSATDPSQTTAFGPDSLSLAQFNGALGTLTSVKVTLSVTGAESASVFNFNGTPKPYTVDAQTAISATTGALTVSTTLDSGSFSGTAAPFTPITLTGPTVTQTASGFVAGSLAAYIGNGVTTFNVDVTGGTANVTGSIPANVLVGGSANVAETVTIEYTYTVATPDGGVTMALLGAALGGVALLKRREA